MSSAPTSPGPRSSGPTSSGSVSPAPTSSEAVPPEPASPSATEWRTRPEAPADIAAVRAVNLAAFPTASEADLVDALRADEAWIPGLSIVTVAPDGSVAGHALLTRCRVEGAPALALAPVAVTPEHQRTGAGSAAVRAALRAARELGEDLVLVLGHPDYYPRFGFARASELGIRAPFEVPDEALMALRLRPEGAPAPTGVIQYAAPFGV
ncbi:GNAT family N-acetyltransferase [Streptomyces xanthochromogenes]|uniref:GNAT family N-acetyltransferase n=1 Tax=Streptomyces xanthochromogenes TaxID=67384 RepID=UPI00382EDB98